MPTQHPWHGPLPTRVTQLNECLVNRVKLMRQCIIEMNKSLIARTLAEVFSEVCTWGPGTLTEGLECYCSETVICMGNCSVTRTVRQSTTSKFLWCETHCLLYRWQTLYLELKERCGPFQEQLEQYEMDRRALMSEKTVAECEVLLSG